MRGGVVTDRCCCWAEASTNAIGRCIVGGVPWSGVVVFEGVETNLTDAFRRCSAATRFLRIRSAISVVIGTGEWMAQFIVTVI